MEKMEIIRKEQVFSLGEMIASAVTDAYYHVSYHGAENIPEQGPALLVPKHLSYLDIIFEGIFLKRHCNRQGNWVMKSGLLGILKYLGGIKVMREQDIEKIQDPAERAKKKNDASIFNKQALDYCRFLYSQGELIVVHAEGTRTPGKVGELDRGMLVFTKLAERKLGIKIPVIPIGIEYERLWVPGSRVYIRAGKPIDCRTPNLAETVREEIRKQSNL